MTDPLTLIHGDCVEVMRSMDEASVDAIVTDPPYGLEFMGKEWDRLDLRQPFRGEVQTSDNPYGRTPVRYPQGDRARSAAMAQEFHAAWATEALRVLRPGGHLLAFGGTRTFHRMTCAIEDAGFEVRDCLMWLYGSGFPKSLDVSKAFDKAAGATRPVLGSRVVSRNIGRVRPVHGQAGHATEIPITEPVTNLARKWQGWGTALKPSFEPIILARKPLIGTVAKNVETYGTGALNIDATRIGTETRVNGGMSSLGVMHDDDWKPRAQETMVVGRWPANVVLDEAAAQMLDEQTGVLQSGDPGDSLIGADRQRNTYGKYGGDIPLTGYGDRGGASRFFYTAKASRADRGKGNVHPTVKPVDLMRWLCRLVTPRGGLVLDPFAGSGTTGQAALAEGFRCVLIEREAEYVEGIKTWRGAMQLGLGA